MYNLIFYWSFKCLNSDFLPLPLQSDWASRYTRYCVGGHCNFIAQNQRTTPRLLKLVIFADDFMCPKYCFYISDIFYGTIYWLIIVHCALALFSVLIKNKIFQHGLKVILMWCLEGSIWGNIFYVNNFIWLDWLFVLETPNDVSKQQ